MSQASSVPEIRVRACNSQPVEPNGQYVLYWMTAQRRLRDNFALDRAIEWCQRLNRPLVVFEALRIGYRWASDRLHTFVLQGMREHADYCKALGVSYYPYVEPEADAASGLLKAFASQACAVVSDDFPCFFLPALIAAAGKEIPVRFEVVDSAGLYPMHATSTVFQRAFDFRRMLQRELKDHLMHFPSDNPLESERLPRCDFDFEPLRKRWPNPSSQQLSNIGQYVADLPVDHSVGPALATGGETSASQAMRRFLDARLSLYAEHRSEPETEAASGLSPYLHFGHLGVHRVFQALAEKLEWTPSSLASSKSGAREGWWGMNANGESFLDELITWRELGYNFCSKRRDYDRFDSLPEWAKSSLIKHEKDKREKSYTLPELESASTYDALWNAAQTQLVREGRMHNYLRMLWGKKILEWSPTPRDALHAMIELNNKYAVDGRNPNSYSGIMWVLGRYDRPWGPERPIYGVIRYMSSDNTAKKFRVKGYIARYSAPDRNDLFAGQDE